MADKMNDYDYDELSAPYTFYSVPVAAALWCGISKGDVEAELARCVKVEEGIWRHPEFPGFEFRCRTLHDAIDRHCFHHFDKHGKRFFGRLAPDEIHLQHSELKRWMEENHPKHRPPFLFGEAKQSLQLGVTAEIYHALLADLDAMKAANSEISATLAQAQNDNQILRAEIDSLAKELHHERNVDARARSTYVTLIGALVELMFGKTIRGTRHSIFRSQAELVDVLVEKYGHLPGIAKRTLETKFAEAKGKVGAPL